MTTPLFKKGGLALITALLFGFSTAGFGQTYIDEDFLKDLHNNAYFMLHEKAPAFAETSTPAKWDKESAVIIGFSRSVLFDRKNSGGFFTRRERSLYFFEKNRLRIKLNDNNSVNTFSEIYFRYGSKEDGFIARIIKPGDTAVDIDLKSAVAVEKGFPIPGYFESFFDKVAGADYQYYKVAVPNLEPGDILEYVTTTRSKLNVGRSGYIEFSPVYEVCSKEYPVMHNEIAIETDDKSFFKSLSQNGAPTFKKEATADNGFFRFVFIDKNRETEKDVDFVSPFVQYPFVKFQVIYSNDDQVKGALIGTKGELKSNFSKEELARKAWEDYETVSEIPFQQGAQNVQAFVSGCFKELVSLGAKEWTEDQYATNAYYYLRHRILFMQSYLPDKLFAYIYGSLLFQRDIKSELVITTGNNIGVLKDVLFEEEIRYVIKVGDKFYFNITDFSNPGELDETLLNNEAWIIEAPAKKGGAQVIKPFKLPGTSAGENVAAVGINAELSSDFSSLRITRTSNYKGIQKAKVISSALKYTTYMLGDEKYYGGEDRASVLTGLALDQYKRSVNTLTEEYSKQKPEYLKKSLEQELGMDVLNARFNLLSDGRSQKKNALIYKEEFELPDFVRKAGKKYLLNLPGLIGSQLQVKKEQRSRKFDIDVRSPKTYMWVIQFRVPPGYKAEGLSELNQTIENETGIFKVAASEQNGIVVINMLKTYKQKDVPAAKWNDMLAFIDAAYNNKFRYILLTPKP